MNENKNSNIFNTPIAHRGLFDNAVYPENTEPAFLEAIRLGYAIEMDVQMTLDKVLIVFHDNDLKRTLGANGDVRNLTYNEIKNLTPFNKGYPIMTFSNFLKLVDGKVPILVEIKHQINKGIEELVCLELDKYKGEFAVESFNPNIIYRIRKLRPRFTVGVLCTKEPKVSSKLVKFFMNNFGFKLYVKCDFLAVRVQDLLLNGKKLKKDRVITWTVRNEEELKIAEKYAENIIFEKTVPTLSKFGEKKF